MVRYKGQSVKTSRRFWEIAGGAVRCAGCSTRMRKYTTMARGHSYAYYKCTRISRDGKDACSPDRHRTYHRAENLEDRVWELVSGLLKNPEQLRADLERMIDHEREGTRSNPEREMKTWFGKLLEIDQMRHGYQEQAAKGLMTLDELGAVLRDLDESRRTAKQKLEAIRRRQARIEQLERDKDALTPEERHHVYRMLQLDVLIHPVDTLEVSGAFAEGPLFSNHELVSDHRQRPKHNKLLTYCRTSTRTKETRGGDRKGQQ